MFYARFYITMFQLTVVHKEEQSTYLQYMCIFQKCPDLMHSLDITSMGNKLVKEKDVSNLI